MSAGTALPRDAEATKARLIAAATAEFAAHGIAGARVDRIAEAAQANKAQIYHYFGSKDELFDAVFGAYAAAATEGDYFDAGDLPGTAGRIYDQFADAPELTRLATWYRLERAGRPEVIEAIASANAAKIEAIRTAQRAGQVTDRFPAEIVLALMLVIVAGWGDLPPEFAIALGAHDAAARRAFTVAAVTKLVAP